jgi:putative ABC transport system permease protein
VNRLDIRLRPGADTEAFRARLEALLPPGVKAGTPEVEAERGAAASRAYRLNLNMLALVALFTGGFLVFSTLALAVMRRRRELALLRVLGVTRRGIVAVVLLEGALIGVVGAGLGIALGRLLAGIVVGRLGGDLGAGYFSLLEVELRTDPGALAVLFGLGVAAAVLGALVPGIGSAGVPPARALRAGDASGALGGTGKIWPGALLMATAAALAFAPPAGGIPIPGYLSIALLLVGAVLITPRAGSLALGLLRLRHPVPAWLAMEKLRGQPGQTSLSMAAMLVSVSLMVSMSIMVASFRQSLDDWLARVLPADLYLRSAPGGESAYFTPEQQARIRSTTGVADASFLRNQTVWLDARRAPVSLLARNVDPSRPERALPLVGTWTRPAAGQPPPVWISEAVQDLYGLRLGETLSIPLGGRYRPFTVAGVWRDYARQNGAIVMEWDTYQSVTGDRLANDAAIWLSPGQDRAAVEKALRAQLPEAGGLEMVETGRIRAISLAVFDRTFAVTYGMEAVAVLIGLFGISVGIGSQVLARRGEFGMLRHLGLTRRQIASMLALEGGIASALGIAFGGALGGIVSLILVHVINRQSFHWSMDMHAPWAGLAALAAVLIAASAFTAVASGRQAMSGDVVRAVREDW